MPRRTCLDCPTLAETGKSRCRPCQAAIDHAKWLRNPNRDPAYRRTMRLVADRLPLPCALCGETISHSGSDGGALTLDHIEPWSAGGSNDPSNLRPAHKRCNSARGRGQ